MPDPSHEGDAQESERRTGEANTPREGPPYVYPHDVTIGGEVVEGDRLIPDPKNPDLLPHRLPELAGRERATWLESPDELLGGGYAQRRIQGARMDAEAARRAAQRWDPTGLETPEGASLPDPDAARRAGEEADLSREAVRHAEGAAGWYRRAGEGYKLGGRGSRSHEEGWDNPSRGEHFGEVPEDDFVPPEQLPSRGTVQHGAAGSFPPPQRRAEPRHADSAGTSGGEMDNIRGMKDILYADAREIEATCLAGARGCEDDANELVAILNGRLAEMAESIQAMMSWVRVRQAQDAAVANLGREAAERVAYAIQDTNRDSSRVLAPFAAASEMAERVTAAWSGALETLTELLGAVENAKQGVAGQLAGIDQGYSNWTAALAGAVEAVTEFAGSL
jgi:hypothetical protein